MEVAPAAAIENLEKVFERGVGLRVEGVGVGQP